MSFVVGREKESRAVLILKKMTKEKRKKKKQKTKTKTRWERGRIILSLQSPIKKICDGNDHPLHDKHQFNSTITKPSQVIFD